MCKMTELKNNLIELLSAHAACYSDQMKAYSTHECVNGIWQLVPKQNRKRMFKQAAANRLIVLKSLRMVRDWTVDDFRYALHENKYMIQAYVFNSNQN